MIVNALKTRLVSSGNCTIFELLDESLPELAERSVVAISSKVVALCEGRTVPIGGTDKDALIERESSRYLPRETNGFKVSFTITHGMLVPSAGIDESNGNGDYVLWPADPQASANAIRRHLAEKYGLREVGVVLTDSALRPLRHGATGFAIASSGFAAVEYSIGQPDLFGRPLQFTKTNVQDGLAAAAAIVMGEGSQQMPLAVLTDLPFVFFTGRDPSADELAADHIRLEDDLYGPFLKAAPWKQGRGN